MKKMDGDKKQAAELLGLSLSTCIASWKDWGSNIDRAVILPALITQFYADFLCSMLT